MQLTRQQITHIADTNVRHALDDDIDTPYLSYLQNACDTVLEFGGDDRDYDNVVHAFEFHAKEHGLQRNSGGTL